MLWLGHHAGHPFFRDKEISRELEDVSDAFRFLDYEHTVEELEAFMRCIELETCYRRRTDNMGLPL